MSETIKNMEYLAAKSGVRVIKHGEIKMKNFGKAMNIDGLVSGLVDVPVSDKENPLTMGYFSMTPSEEFEFTYTYLEVKVLIRGHFTMTDEDGNTHRAEAGDVVILSPKTTVKFHKDSDGHAFYVAHREADPDFM